MHCSLSELPECQRTLAQNNDVIEQVLQVANSPLFTYNTARNAILCLESLAQSLEAHSYLLQPKVLSGLLEICQKRRAEVQAHNNGIAAIAFE